MFYQHAGECGGALILVAGAHQKSVSSKLRVVLQRAGEFQPIRELTPLKK